MQLKVSKGDKACLAALASYKAADAQATQLAGAPSVVKGWGASQIEDVVLSPGPSA